MEIFLGTALWGWGVDRTEAFRLLDRYYECGGRFVDAAANYPINKVPRDFGAANRIVVDWLRSNPGTDVRVLCKIGSVNNLGGPEAALNPSDILLCSELALNAFGEALQIVAVHWDNREDEEAIGESVDALFSLVDEGFEIGFSGVKRPELYAKAIGDRVTDWWIQVKENAATKAARLHYTPHFPRARYLAYGINMGGVKMAPPTSTSSLNLRGAQEPPVAQALRELLSEADRFTPKPRTLNDIALALTCSNSDLSGVIIGPRNIAQLDDTMTYIAQLQTEAALQDLRNHIEQRLLAS